MVNCQQIERANYTDRMVESLGGGLFWLMVVSYGGAGVDGTDCVIDLIVVPLSIVSCVGR